MCSFARVSLPSSSSPIRRDGHAEAPALRAGRSHLRRVRPPILVGGFGAHLLRGATHLPVLVLLRTMPSVPAETETAGVHGRGQCRGALQASRQGRNNRGRGDPMRSGSLWPVTAVLCVIHSSPTHAAVGTRSRAASRAVGTRINRHSVFCPLCGLPSSAKSPR